MDTVRLEDHVAELENALEQANKEILGLMDKVDDYKETLRKIHELTGY